MASHAVAFICKATDLFLMQAQAGYALSGFSSELSLSPNGGIAAAVPGPGMPGQSGQHASSVSLSNDAQPTFMVPVSLSLLLGIHHVSAVSLAYQSIDLQMSPSAQLQI